MLKWWLIVFVTLAALVSFGEAHRSGCHRWHSCPSDSGSYACGDLGYDTYCPKETPSNAQSSSASVAPPAPRRPTSVSRGVPYIHSYDLRSVGVVIARERGGWFQLGVNRSSLRVKAGSLVGFYGRARKQVRLTARPVIWEGALHVPARTLRTLGCSLDTSFLPSGVLADCGRRSGREIIFVKTW